MTTLETLKRKVVALPVPERKRLAGHLFFADRPKEELMELQRQMDDKDPSRWLTLEEAEAYLAKIPEPPGE